MSIDAVRGFFEAWNRRDMDAAMAFIADGCVYDDITFEKPHEGKESVRALFENVAKAAPDVRFEIDALTGDRDVGALWHVTVAGVTAGRGVSYYRFDEDDKLVWALDAPEPAEKSANFHGDRR